MSRKFTLEYWRDGKWFAGQLKEVPGVFSQGKTLKELQEHIQEVYQLMMEETAKLDETIKDKKMIEVEVVCQ